MLMSEPYVKPIKGKDLFELRIKFASNVSRVFYFAYRQIMKEGVTMGKAEAKFSEVREFLMKDKEFKAEYEKLKPRYDVISQIIEARTSQNITQEELALRVGTQKSNISRLESGTYNPSLDFLSKIARSLGKDVQVILK